MRAVDTSVAVAALIPWHEAHEASRPFLVDAAVPAHVLAETYAVMTRLPRPLSRSDAAELLERAFPEERILVPSAELQRALVSRCAELSIDGGAIYDALIAFTTLEHGQTLVSRDRRALRTYHEIGVDTDWVGA